MKLGLLALIVGFFWTALAQTSAAQTFPVRSGEHESFSRLVIVPRGEAAWTVQSEPGRAEIGFDRVDWSLDTSAVFDLIPKTRVESVVWDDTAKKLILELNCDCGVTAFNAGGTAIAIDVTDAGSPPFAGPDTAAPVAVAQEPLEIPWRFTELLPTFNEPAIPTPPAAQPPQSGDPALEEEQATAARQISVQEFEERLLRQLSQGAVEGIVVANPDVTDQTNSTTDTTSVPNNFQLRTAFSDLQSDAVIEALNPSTCPPQDWVDVVRWAGDSAPTDMIADARAALTPTVGEADDKDRIEAAQKLVAAGFGLEARRTLETISDRTEEWHVLFDLAKAVDQPLHVPDTSKLNSYDGCKGPGLLWAQLAVSDDTPMDPENSQYVAEAFNELPQHLRQHIGTALIKSLVDRGNVETASLIRSLMPKRPEIPDAELAIVDAQLAQKKGQDDIATELVEEAKSGNTQASRDALLKSLRASLDSGSVPTPGDVELAMSYAFEQQGTEGGTDIEILVARAQAALQDFQGAFDRLDTISESAGATRSKEIRDVRVEISSLVLERASDASFLEFYAKERPRLGDLDDSLSLPLAKRLVDIGVADSALQELEPFGASTNEEIVMLTAKALNMDARPRLALSRLGGLDTPEANRLRADIYLSLGRHSEAALAFAELEDFEKAQRAALISGDAGILETVLELSEAAPDDREKLVASVQEAISESDSERSLAAAQSLLERAERSRSLIDAALNVSVGN